MSTDLRIRDAIQARDVALTVAKSMRQYLSVTDFNEITYDSATKTWNVKATYYDTKLTFKIDAVTGTVIEFLKK